MSQTPFRGRVLFVTLSLLTLTVGAASWLGLRRAGAPDRAPAGRALLVEDRGDGSIPRWSGHSPHGRPPGLPFGRRSPLPALRAVKDLDGSSPTRSTLEEAVRVARTDVLRKKGDSYAYNCTEYGATIAAGGVDFGLPVELPGLGQPVLSLTLEEVRSGTTVIAKGGPASPTARPGRGEVVYDRGSVEEVYALNPDGIEESVVIRSLPGQVDDLSVRLAVRTNLAPPDEALNQSSLGFACQGRRVITLSRAVARDAAGRELTLGMTYTPGRLSLTVPASWLADAKLPVVVDPLLGSAINVHDPANLQPRAYRGVEVAYGAAHDSYLVVWTEQVGATFDLQDVRGQFVSASGALLGGPLSIGDAPGTDAMPSVSYAPSVDRFLVAYYEDRGGVHTAGRIVQGDGTLAASPVILDARAPSATSIAFDGTNWLVLFGMSEGTTGYSLHGRFVGTDGTPGAAMDVDPDLDNSAYGSLAFAGGTYMVAWTKMVQNTPLFVRAFSPSGTPQTTRTVLWSDPSESVLEDQAIAGGSGKYLVTWSHTGSSTFRGIVIDPAATPLAGPFLLENGYAPGPRIAFSSTNQEWVVSYIFGFPLENYEVYTRRVSTAGALAPRERLTVNSTTEWAPSIAWNSTSNQALVAFYQGLLGNPLAVVAQRIDLNVLPPLAPTSLAAVAGNNTVSLSWATSAGASSYTVKRGTAAGGPYSTTFPGLSTPSLTDTTAVNGTTYYYVVTAVNSFGESGPSNEVSATPLPPPPGAPTALSATPSDGSVDLTWTAPAGAASYSVFRTTLSGGSYSAIASGLGTTTYHDSGLVNDTTYYYVVSASNAGGTGPYSNQAQATPRTPSAQVLFVTGSSVLGAGDLAAESRLRALGYTTVLRTGPAAKTSDATGKALVVVSSTITSGDVNTKFRNVPVPVVTWENALHDDFGMTGLTSGTDYGTSGGQTSLAVANASHPLAAGLSGTVTVSGSAIYSWGVPNANAAKVATLTGNAGRSVIFAYETGASMPGLVAPARRVGFFLEDLTASVWNAQGQALFDAAIGWASGGSGAGAPPPPVGLVATGGNGQVTLSWTASGGGVSYTVLRGTQSGGPYAIIVSGLSTPAYTDIGLTNETTYYYVVTVQKAGASSGSSAEAFATPTGFPVSALLVVGNTTLGAGDLAVKSRLESLGFTVQVKDGPSSITSDANGKAIVVVSSTITSGNVNTKFRTVPVPVLNWENALHDDFGMTGPTGGTDYGTTTGQTQLSIIGAGHPLAAGLSGVVSVSSTSAIFSWGVPNGNAIPIATLSGDATKTPVFGYEIGSTMPGLIAPARRVGFFLEDLTASGLTTAGWRLFDAAVRWLANATPGAPAAPSTLIATAGAASVDLSWSVSPGATNYSVKRAPTSGGPYVVIQGNVAGSTFTDTAVTPSITYFYVVTAFVGTAESGVSNEALATPGTPRPALFVVGNTTLGTGDQAVKTRLQGLGFAVTVKDGPSSATADASGKALVVVSSTITSSTVNTKFRTVGVPVINWENALFDDFGMTGLVAGTDYGTSANQSTLLSIDSTHPLAAGLSGTVAVTTQGQIFSWGVPGPQAARVATLSGDPTKTVVFGYESGSTMPGLAAPARRVGFFLEDLTAGALGVNGWRLFDAAVQWAVNSSAPTTPPPPPTITTPASGSFQTTPSPLVTGTSSAGGLTITLFLDGFPAGTVMSQTGGAWSLVPAAFLAEGTHTLTAIASNAAGDSPPSAPITVVVDTSLPVIFNASPAPGATVTTATPVVSALWSDPVSGIVPGTATITLDGATVQGATVTATGFSFQPTLSAGSHTVAAQVSNGAGLVGSVSWSFTVQSASTPVSLTNPTIPAGSFVNTTQPSFSGTLTNTSGTGINPGSIVVRLDGIVIAATVQVVDANTVIVTFTPSGALSAGPHTIQIEGTTTAGTPLSTTVDSFTVDLTAPVISALEPANGSLQASSTVTVTATISDTGGAGVDPASVFVVLNGIQLPAPFTSPDGQSGGINLALPAFSSDGTQVITVKAKDRAGNPAADATSTFVSDGFPPQIAILAPQDQGNYPSTSIPVDVLVSDAGVGVNPGAIQITVGPDDVTSQLQMASAAPNAFGYPPSVHITGTITASGSNLLAVTAVDAVQNSGIAFSSFVAPGGVPPVEGTPGVTVDIVTTSVETPPLETNQPPPPEYWAAAGLPIKVKLQLTSRGQPLAGCAIEPTITSGFGSFFFNGEFNQVSDDTGKAGFIYIGPKKPGFTDVSVTAKYVQTGSSPSYHFKALEVFPHVDLGADFPGAGTRAFVSVFPGVGRTTVEIQEVDSQGNEVTDPAAQKFTIYRKTYLTEPDSTVNIPLLINSTATGVGYLKATCPEFEDQNGKPTSDTGTSNINYYLTTDFDDRGMLVSGSGQIATPNQPLKELIVVKPVIFHHHDGATYKVIQAYLLEPGEMTGRIEPVNGVLLIQNENRTAFEAIVTSADDTLSFRYTAGPEGKSANIHVLGFEASNEQLNLPPETHPTPETPDQPVTPPPPVATLSGSSPPIPPDWVATPGDGVTVQAPVYRFVWNDSSGKKRELATLPLIPWDRLATPDEVSAIPAARFFQLEVSIPNEPNDFQVVLEAADQDGLPLEDYTGFYPDLTTTITMEKKPIASDPDRFVSKNLLATRERRTFATPPNFSFMVFRMGEYVLVKRNGNEVAKVRASMRLDSGIPDPTRTPFDVVVNGKLNLFATAAGSARMVLSTFPGKQDRVQDQAVMVIRQLGAPLGTVTMRSETGVALDLNCQGDGDQVFHYNYPAAGATPQEMTLQIFLTYQDDRAPVSEVRVPIRIRQSELFLGVQCHYVTAGTLTQAVQDRVTSRVWDIHKGWNKPIWIQAGVHLLTGDVSFLPNQPANIVTYNPTDTNATTFFRNFAAASTDKVTVFIVNQITGQEGRTGITMVNDQPAGKRWVVVDKSAFGLTSADAYVDAPAAYPTTSHELGHAANLFHVAHIIDGNPQFNNRYNLMWTMEDLNDGALMAKQLGNALFTQVVEVTSTAPYTTQTVNQFQRALEALGRLR